MSTAPFGINGSTRVFAIMGDPIAQVRSPQDFTERFATAGMNAVFIPAHIREHEFDQVAPGFLKLANLAGLVITLPYKARMLPFCSRVGRAAEVIGAVNVMRREPDSSWTGDMFDGVGFVWAAQSKADLRRRRVLQFGAGGAGSGIAYSLAEAGVASIDLSDPRRERVQVLIDRLTPAFPNCRFAEATSERTGYDMIVNASTVGMRPGDGLPGEIGALTCNSIVGEVVNSEAPTALEQLAIEQGCPHVRGLEMHAAQMDTLMHYLTGH